MQIRLSWLEGADREVALPSYETAGAAGPICAPIPGEAREGVTLAPVRGFGADRASDRDSGGL